MIKNLAIRALSGGIYVGLIIAALVSGQLWVGLLCALFAVLGLFEFYRLAGNIKGHISVTVLDILAGLVAFYAIIALFAGCQSAKIAVFIYGVYFVARVIVQVFSEDFDPLKRLSASLMGHIYVALPLALLVCIYIMSPALAAIIFGLIWINDTGAYLVGISIGRHRLFPRVSPKKSWEGLFGGILFTIGGGILCATMIPKVTPFYGIGQFIMLAVVVSLAATFGDLLESTLKRSAGVKDSGKLIPGHGGMLDRIDSLLLVVPTVMILTVGMNIFKSLFCN